MAFRRSASVWNQPIISGDISLMSPRRLIQSITSIDADMEFIICSM